MLIASVGKSYLGDIAIDDISVTDGYCVVVPPSPSLQPTPPIHSQGPPIPPGKTENEKIYIFHVLVLIVFCSKTE